MNVGKFIISLDFELFWGVRDKRTIAGYGKNIAKVQTIIPQMLGLFKKYEIAATFATVGFLFSVDKNDLIDSSPEIKPNYIDNNLSPYGEYIEGLPMVDEFHFALPLIKQILRDGHEIATHTFSHYYCLEPGQNIDTFKADIEAAKKIAVRNGIHLGSIVFPRNQYNKEYISVCSKFGINSYRGNEKSWFYKSAPGKDEGLVKRAFRLADAYFNISGFNTYVPVSDDETQTLNLPASSFLRPFSKRLKVLEPLKLSRIKKAMTYAAKNKEVFHLWWHPHNFGNNTDENFEMFEKILRHFSSLKDHYSYQSVTMKQLTDEINGV